MNKFTTFIAIAVILVVGYLAYIVATKDSWDAGTNQPPAPVNGVDTAEWKTYRNEQYGFEVKYPENWYYAEKANIVFFDFRELPEVIPDSHVSTIIKIGITPKHYLKEDIERINKTLKLAYYQEGIVNIGGLNGDKISGWITGDVLGAGYYAGIFINKDNQNYSLVYNYKDEGYLAVFNSLAHTLNFIR